LLGTSLLEFNTYRIININYSSICLQGKNLRDLKGKSILLYRAFYYKKINVTYLIEKEAHIKDKLLPLKVDRIYFIFI
jgi:hypothetical protein